MSTSTATLRQLTDPEHLKCYDEYDAENPNGYYPLQCSACASVLFQGKDFNQSNPVDFVFHIKYCWNCGRRFVPDPNDPALVALLKKQRLQRDLQLLWEEERQIKDAVKAMDHELKGDSNT